MAAAEHPRTHVNHTAVVCFNKLLARAALAASQAAHRASLGRANGDAKAFLRIIGEQYVPRWCCDYPGLTISPSPCISPGETIVASLDERSLS